MKKYKNELYEVMHELDLAFFEAGAISEDELRELEKDCFIAEDVANTVGVVANETPLEDIESSILKQIALKARSARV
jgi:hypothetical protein